MRQKIRQVGKKLYIFLKERYDKTDSAVYLLLLVNTFVVGGLCFLEIGIPRVAAFFLFGTLATLAVVLAVWIAGKLLKLFLYRGEKHLVTLSFLFVFICYFCLSAGMGIVPKWQSVVTAVVIFGIAVVFIRSLFALVLCKGKRRSVLAICTLSGLAFMLILLFVFSDGFDDTYVASYLMLGQDKGWDKAELLRDEISEGGHEVGMIEYGSEQKRVKPRANSNLIMLESSSFDLSPYVDGYEGLDTKYRKLQLGYDINHVPLAGRIWYPKDGQNCPVLFIVHGNHIFTTQSYLGYDYLGTYLASHGYVVVSVDENFCNADMFGNLEEENDARAVLFLENIGKVLFYSRQKGNPLYQKIDGDNIAIAGHSRGGEAVAIAAYFNTLGNYPEDGRIRFSYHYPIKSVIAIAPSVDQYLPVDRSVELEDINYLLIQGANDQDISVFMGLKQYNNIFFSGEGDYFKSYLYIARANHGQFNSRWGRYDKGYPFSEILNVENLMKKKQQQKILRIFTKKFLDDTLLKQTGQRDLFYSVQSYQEILPETIYIQGFQDSSYEMVCDFEEDLDLKTGTMEGCVISAGNVKEWTEKLSRFSNSTFRMSKGDYALSMGWANTRKAYVNMRFPALDVKGRKLSFDIMNMNNAQVKREEYDLLDCSIILTDKDGNKASASTGEYCTIYPPLPVRLSKLQFLFDKNEYKHQFQTVVIPVSSFEGEGFDPGSVTSIRFLFDKKDRGMIRLDDVGFME